MGSAADTQVPETMGRRPGDGIGRRLSASLMFALMVALVGMACTVQSPTPTTSTTSTVPATTWDFDLRVGMPDALVTKYGGLTAARSKVDQQLATVNTRFADQFEKPIRWKVKEFYTYSQSASEERLASRNGADFLLLYSENETLDDGGWHPATYSVVIRWTEANGGVFGQYGADSLVHELGHARGAIDLYALSVGSNPVNGVGYSPPGGAMTYPYGVVTFDDYSKHIINASADVVYNDDHVVQQSVPSTYTVKVVNGSGTAVPGATIRVYPVDWYSSAVTNTVIMSGSTTTPGTWTLTSNPFNPGLPYPWWHLERPLVLVTATAGASKGSAWIALPDAGNWFFSHPGSAYNVTITVA